MEQLSFQSLPVLGWLFESTIYISILICLIFIIKTFTKKKLPAWWGYCLWLLLLVRMLIPFGVETPVSVYNYVPAPPENSTYMTYLVEYKINIPFIQNAPGAPPVFTPDAVPPEADLSTKPVVELDDTHESIVKETSGFNLSLDRVLLLLWLTGLLAFGVATIYKNCNFWLIVRREQPISDKDILDLFNECRSTLGLQKKVEIIVTDSVKSPAIFGYVKPQLLLPPHFLDTLNKDELYCIFMHELGHVKRHDIGVTWLATLFQVIYWFNPLLWYAFHHLRADQEAACDAYVLSKIKQVRPTDYARTIVNLLQRFVQNRQLPSLAGIIENKSQIDRRISMILDYKRITLKKTLVSILMLLVMIGAFFACSTGRLADRKSSGSGIPQLEGIEMKHYKSDDWYFSVDIPKNWNVSPSLPAYFTNNGELISFGSNEDGLNALVIRISQSSPKQPLNEIRDEIQKQMTAMGATNFSSTEAAMGTGKVLIIDFDREVEGKALHSHVYLIPKKSMSYGLGFVTDKKDITFELYDRIAETFKAYDPPVVDGIKKYISPDEEISFEIPGNWYTFPNVKEYGELVRFGSPDNGLTAIVYNPSYLPWESLEARRTRQQETIANEGWKNFIESETIIGGRKTLIFDCDNGYVSLRDYFFKDGDYIYMAAFFAYNKDGILSDKLEEYDKVMKSCNFSSKPAVIGMKEYEGPDLEKSLVSGTKRYLSADGDYTVDVPDDWRLYSEETGYGRIDQFRTPENLAAAVFYPRAFSPWLTLEKRRDNQVKVNTDAGWSIQGKSETVINGREVLMLDSNQGVANIRNYFFKEGEFVYSVLFYAFNAEGIPADRTERYERVMNSINIISVKPEEIVGFKEYIGTDIKKPTASGMKRYISPDGGYTVDIPGDWRHHAQNNEYGETYVFGTSENGITAIFYPRGYSPELTLEEMRENHKKTGTDAGWRVLGESETVINGIKTSILDSNKDAINIRNYTFKEGDYIYSVVFYAFNTEGIPADRIEGYEKVIKSINIINAGPDHVKPLDSNLAQTGTLPVQFRLGENEPGRDLEEMTVLGSDRKVYLHKESVLSNAEIMTAVAQKTETSFGVGVTFTEAGGKKFAEITKNNVGKIMGIVMDGKLINAPVIRVPITGGKAFIEGKFTLEEAKRFARGILGEK